MSLSTRLATTAAITATALAALFAAPAAQARSDVQWNISIGLPLPPLPYVEIVPSAPPPHWRDRDRDGIPDYRDRYDNRRPIYAPYGYGYGDRDRDGIPNRWDRRDDRWRHDHHPRHPHWSDRDRDGIPDQRDRYDNRRRY